MYPQGREIVLGVAGGISAYKSCELLRRLQDVGCQVTVVPTRASLNFVGVSTWEALSGRPVPIDLWNNVHQVPHISLAKKADLLVVAPATADLMAKVAAGIADDLLTNILLASDVPTIFVPAMHSEMWRNAATQANVLTLRARGYVILEPATGKLTSGDTGIGRYPELEVILTSVAQALDIKTDLKGRSVLISAGGTREAIDPVRYIGNYSTGKQGYALAQAAVQRGATVTLVAANSALPDIEGVRTIHVRSAQEMLTALVANFAGADVLIMAAAVSDVRPALSRAKKIPKGDFAEIALLPNPDITKELAGSKRGQVMIGFAAQTEENLEDALGIASAKLQDKELDFIYCNDVSGGAIFGSDLTSGVILDSTGRRTPITEQSKLALANKLFDLLLDKLS